METIHWKLIMLKNGADHQPPEALNLITHKLTNSGIKFK
jgi:hypothetical protein